MSDDMELYDLRVTVDSIAGRPVCVGDGGNQRSMGLKHLYPPVEQLSRCRPWRLEGLS